MEVILDELQTQGVDIDMRTLSHHINYFVERHEEVYSQMVARINPDEMHVVFNMINVVNFGRAVAYLALIYLMKDSEDVTRRAVRLVATVLKTIDFAQFKIEESSEESFFDRMVTVVKRIFWQ